MAFDPDAYLKSKEGGFDPDAYLKAKGSEPEKEDHDILTPDLPLGLLETGTTGAVQAVGGALARGLGGVAGALTPGDTAASEGQKWVDKFNEATGDFLNPKTESGKGIAEAIGKGIEGFQKHYQDPENVKHALQSIPFIGTPLSEVPQVQAAASAGAQALPEASMLLPFMGREGKKAVPTKVSKAVEELNAAPKPPENIPNLKATEGPNGQMALFDIPEEARVPMKYEAYPGDWRVDENGMPIRADLSLDVQHAETPLQRDLWVDQTPEFAKMQETGRYNKAGELEPSPTTSYPVSLDQMDWAHKRGALKQSGLMKGEIEAPGPLESAAIQAEGYTAPEIRSGSPDLTPEAFARVGRLKGQGGAINPEVFKEGFRKLEKVTDDLAITVKGLGDKLNVEAWSGGQRVGGLLLEKTNKYDPAAIVDAFAPAVGVDKSFRGRGIARKMYEAAAKLGNDIVPSKRRTAEGQKMWEGFEKSGLSQNMRIPRSQRGAVLVDWSNKDKVDALKNVPGLGSRLREIAHAQITTPEEAIKLAKDAPDVQQNFAQKAVSMLTKGGIYLKAKLNNPIVHFGVDRFLDADNKARAEISDKLHASYLPALRDLSSAERTEAFTILNAADLNKKTITPEMMDRWGLSDKQKTFIQMHQERMADVLNKINIARAAVGKKPIEAREAYSSMSMSGDFRKVVTKDGEVVGVLGANTKFGLAKLEKQMQAKDPAYQFGPIQEAGKARAVKGSPHEAFMEVLQTLGEDNPKMKEFLDTLAQVAKDDPSNYMGMQKHTMQKKGVWGMEGRKPWLSAEENAKAFFENQVKYMENAYQWAQLTEAAKDVNHVIRDPAMIEKQGNAIKITEEYMQNALGMNPSKVGEGLNKTFEGFFDYLGLGPSVPRKAVSAVKQASNTMLLSLNPAFWGINLLQPVAAMPGMASMLSSLGLKTGHTFGMVDFAKGNLSFNKKLLMPSKLTPLEKGAFEYAKENHVYATDMVEHANQVQKGTSYYMSKIGQGPAAGIETSTRATMYMAFVHMLDSAGLKGKEVYQQSARLTDMAMNNYSAIEKPRIYNALGPIGSMAYNLRSYGHNEISRISMYARELAQHGDAKPLLTQMATTIAFAGVMGLPFFTQWDELYKFITAKLGKPRSLTLDTMEMSKQLADKVGSKYQYALSNGLFTLAGVDLSKRIGLGDVLPNTAAEAAFAGGGKLASMGKAVYQFAKNPSEETTKGLAYNFAPAIAQGPMDLAWYQKGDLAYSKDPEKLRPLAKRNATDKLMRVIGVQGINESSQKTKQYEQKQISQTISGYRTAAMNSLAQDLFRNRPLNQNAINKYFVDGQGDGKTFESDLNKLAFEQNISPQQLTLIKDAASKRIPQLMELQRNLR